MGSWDAFLELAKVLGLPLALSLAAVWALATDRVVTKKMHDKIVAHRDDQIRELHERNGRTEEREQKYLDALPLSLYPGTISSDFRSPLSAFI